MTSPFSVLCGRNNSGKTFLLRHLISERREGVRYLGPARYQNFTQCTVPGGPGHRRQQTLNELGQLHHPEQNTDHGAINLRQVISDFNDDERQRLLGLVDQLLGTQSCVEPIIPDNSMSPRYISVDGHNLSYTSTGFRLVMTLLAALADSESTSLVIDEPELGLSPEIQGTLMEFLLNDAARNEHFPHIEHIVLATHSPIFLDRQTVTNNYFVERSGSEITIRRLKTVQDLNSLQFFLLGNRFESLFLPSAIILVEGKTDFYYLKRLVALHFPNATMPVILCGNDSQIKNVVHVARQMLSDIRQSPYADRIFVVLDSQHEASLIQSLTKMGIAEDNIIVWENNGIEYVYPRSILEKKFRAFEQITINGDWVSANGITATKNELAEFVVDNLTAEDELPPELREKFIEKLAAITF